MQKLKSNTNGRQDWMFAGRQKDYNGDDGSFSSHSILNSQSSHCLFEPPARAVETDTDNKALSDLTVPFAVRQEELIKVIIDNLSSDRERIYRGLSVSPVVM